MGRRVLPLQMDLLHLDQINRAIAAAAEHFGRIEILVNNAGVAPENPAWKDLLVLYTTAFVW
ncbi:MAG: SDR family NAD(P)-dependent oxidoreductase [Bryobacteraceae bacterium]